MLPSRIPVLTTVRQVRQWRQAQRALEVGFVPTMGSLHQGHLDLVKQSMARSPRTILSIFVNPSQFGPTEDLLTYPRNLSSDLSLLSSLLPPSSHASSSISVSPSSEGEEADVEVDLTTADSPLVVFCPQVGEMYPNGITTNREEQRGTFVEVKGFGDILEGKTRPNFFRGVSTVVAKLFNIVQPDIAHFGQKDIQQALLLRIMLKDLHFTHPTPSNLLIHPTTRSLPPANLALSSRNAYLSSSGLDSAPTLYRALEAGKALFDRPEGCTLADLQKAASLVISSERQRTKGLVEEEYITLFHPSTFSSPLLSEKVGKEMGDGEGWVLVGAIKCDGVRLIDNLLLGVDVGQKRENGEGETLE